MLNHADLVELQSMARDYWVAYPAKIRLKGMDRRLTEAELNSMAHYEAALMQLTRKGLIPPGSAQYEAPLIDKE